MQILDNSSSPHLNGLKSAVGPEPALDHMLQLILKSTVPQESDSFCLGALHNESQLITQQILIFSMNCVSKTEELELASVIVPNSIKTHLPGCSRCCL